MSLRRSHEEAKLLIEEFRVPCVGCGEDRAPTLEFHHIDPSLKSFAISHAWRKKGKQKILEEIAKCVVVCANCHKLIHAGWMVVTEDGGVMEVV